MPGPSELRCRGRSLGGVSRLRLAQPWLTLRRCQPKMTACATSPAPTPPLDRVPPPAGGGGCCTGGGPPHGRVPVALPPPASGSPADRPRRRGPAPQPSPSRPRTRSRPRRRGGGSGPIPRSAPGSPTYSAPTTAGTRAHAHHDFPDAGLTAVFEHSRPMPRPAGIASSCAAPTASSSSRPRTGPRRRSRSSECPAAVLRGDARYRPVRQCHLHRPGPELGRSRHRPVLRLLAAASFGPLNATTEVRRDVLAGCSRERSSPTGRARRPLPVHRAGQLRPRQARHAAVRR